MATHRITKDIAEIKRYPNGQSVVLSHNNMTCEVLLRGTPSSPYEGGRWKLSVQFPDDYPFKAPTIRFMTRIFHPNIGTFSSSSGSSICVDFLKNWSPAMSLQKALLALANLLVNPNPDDPLNSAAAKLYKDDPSGYVRRVVDDKLKYAMSD